MHWGDLYELLEKLQQSHHLPALVVGLIAGCFLTFVGMRWSGRKARNGLARELRAQLADVRTRLDAATAESIAARNQINDAAQQQQALAQARDVLVGKLAYQEQIIADLSGDCEKLKTTQVKSRAQLKLERQARREAQDRAEKYSDQLDEVMNSDGKIWLKPCSKAPRFVPLPSRRAAIIALANLKGGVGKTTLTANLGAALAARGLRVLLIDLDHQSSLTNRCLNENERKELKRSDRFIDDLFAEGGDLGRLNQCVTPLEASTGSGQLYLAPVRESFVDLETQLMTKWHSGLTDEDVRFRLRQGLHTKTLREHFDVVLIDCPPRLTTGSVNALTACDYILIPVELDDMSADGVPRILAWLKKLQGASCNELNVLGVVGNNAYPRLKLINRERVIWDALKQKSRDAWDGPVHHFDAVIRSHATVAGRFAALDPRHQANYDDLIDEIQRVIPDAHLESASVPAVAHAGAPLDRA